MLYLCSDFAPMVEKKKHKRVPRITDASRAIGPSGRRAHRACARCCLSGPGGRIHCHMHSRSSPVVQGGPRDGVRVPGSSTPCFSRRCFFRLSSRLKVFLQLGTSHGSRRPCVHVLVLAEVAFEDSP